jgi:hypothetical protein
MVLIYLKDLVIRWVPWEQRTSNIPQIFFIVAIAGSNSDAVLKTSRK